MRRAAAAAALAAGLGGAGFAALGTGTEVFTNRLDRLPDFIQTDPAYGLIPFGGRYHCGPASAADAVVWLAGAGFDRLVASPVTSRQDECRLIALLGSNAYCRTAEKKGTSPLRLMEGLAKYARERGYEADVAWRGWRDGGRYAQGRLDDPRLLAEGFEPGTVAILNVGWYTRDDRDGSLSRLGGHYVALAGADFSDPADPRVFIHDPSPRGGSKLRSENCRLVRRDVRNRSDKAAAKAAVYYELEGIILRTNAACALIDGVARFRLQASKTTPSPSPSGPDP